MAKGQGPLSGFRDLLAEQIFPREEVINKIKNVYELYGFVPLKTPALERFETFTNKLGDEGDKLLYSFKDNGDRQVALRYDHTVPLARVIAQYGGELAKPYKRYVVGDSWRGERAQAGRYREFTQFDADIVGASSYLADIEVLAMTADAMNSIGVKTKIRINDRRILDSLSKECGIEKKSEFYKLVGIIDKVDKIGDESVKEEVGKLFGIPTKELVTKYLALSGTCEDKLKEIAKLLNNEEAKEAVQNINKILSMLGDTGYDGQVIFDQTIARGLNYYTGTIFETTLVDLPSIGSICSGGRFDELIEQLGGPSTPAVGTSIGIDRLLEAMNQLNLVKAAKTKTKVYITNVEDGLDIQRFKLAQELREKGIPSEIIYDSPKLGNQIKAIDKLGVEKIIILGSREIEKKIVVIKDLKSGDQKDVPIDEIAEEF
jgi:histidyl-tRNA synthetase